MASKIPINNTPFFLDYMKKTSKRQGNFAESR
nr:MAG TPA: hypothetical protein [Caudoviricetes sp.]